MLIYVIEDDAASRNSLTKMLHSHHHEVIAFSNAVSTTDHITLHGTPDLALIDLKLGTWPDGIHLARNIRLMYPNVAIVMISSYATPKDVAIAFRQGADDFLLRPLEQEEILDSLSEALLTHRPSAHLAGMNTAVGTLRIDADMRKAYWHGTDLQLTPTELVMLTQLAARPRVVINFADLYSVINGEHLDPRDARKRLKSHIANLKQKLRQAAPTIDLPIRTSWGHGIYWDAGEETPADGWDLEVEIVKILYIEDHYFQARTGERAARKIGGEVIAAATGAEAFEKLRHDRFDLILCDLDLPDIDGFELLRRLRSQLPTTPIVVLTGLSLPNQEERCLEAGGTEYILKPLEQDEVESILRKYCIATSH